MKSVKWEITTDVVRTFKGPVTARGISHYDWDTWFGPCRVAHFTSPHRGYWRQAQGEIFQAWVWGQER